MRVTRVFLGTAAAAAIAVVGLHTDPSADAGTAAPTRAAHAGAGHHVTAQHRAGAGHHVTAQHHVTVAAVGDLILGNTPQLPAHPARYLSPVAAPIRGAGVGFANLEGTLTTSGAGKCGGGSSNCYAFRNPPHYARYLAADGFTILNDANNHSHDFGATGLRQTVHSVHAAGMKQTGLPGQVTVVRAGGVRVAVVGFAPYSDTADLLDLRAAKQLIARARRHSDVVVVYMHAGAEGTGAQHVTGHEEHYVGEDRGNPRRFAHLAVRSGADLVIGSGPHVLRGMEFYRHRLIAYSLGNFANFHNFAGGGVLSDSAILHVDLTAHGRFRSARLLAVRLDADGRAHRGGPSLGVVRRLSKADFGPAAARLSHRGVIRPARP